MTKQATSTQIPSRENWSGRRLTTSPETATASDNAAVLKSTTLAITNSTTARDQREERRSPHASASPPARPAGNQATITRTTG